MLVGEILGRTKNMAISRRNGHAVGSLQRKGMSNKGHGEKGKWGLPRPYPDFVRANSVKELSGEAARGPRRVAYDTREKNSQ